MSKRTPKASGFGPMDFRNGRGVRWGGMYTEGDPLARPPGTFDLLINARWRDGEAVDRWGLARFQQQIMGGLFAEVVNHLDDFQVTTPKKLWMTIDGGYDCAGVYTTTGEHVSSYDEEQSPVYQQYAYYDTATEVPVMASFDGHLYVGVGSTLKRLTITDRPYGADIDSRTFLGSTMDTTVHTFSGFAIRALHEFDGKLFIGLDAGAGSSKISSFDGVSIVDELTSLQIPKCFATYRVLNGGDAIFVGFAAGNQIRYRPSGSAPGTWTSVTPGAGTVTSVEMVAYKDVLYIASGGTDVWSYNGTTLASARTPASAVTVNTITTFNGNLVFGYDTLTAARIGTYDGSSWTDVAKDLTAQAAGTTSILSLKRYRSNLYAAATVSAQGALFISPGTTITGTWIWPTLRSTTGLMRKMVVF